MKEEYPTEVKKKYENVMTKTVGSPNVRCHCKKILLNKNKCTQAVQFSH